MKKLLTLLLACGLLAACSSDTEDEKRKEEATPAAETEETGPTDEEVHEKLKAEAKEYTFVELNGDEVAEDTKVKLTGEVTNISEEGMLGEFTLTTKEVDGFGMYSVNNLMGKEVEEGDQVTVYGMYAGKSDLGFPSVNTTIVEPAK